MILYFYNSIVNEMRIKAAIFQSSAVAREYALAFPIGQSPNS